MDAEPTPILPGGGTSALDLSNPRDRGMLRQAMKEQPKRFRAITPEKRDNWVNDLEDVRATAKNIADKTDAPAELRLAAVQTVRACVQTSGMLDAMQQKDELAHAAGKTTDLHHLETLAQADRHHAEGEKVHATSDVRILIADARGHERIGNADDIRALMAPPEAPRETVGVLPVQGQEPGGDGGASGR